MSNKEIKKNSISIISYTELIDRFNYYGLQSLLVLYLTKNFGLEDKQSYEIFGIYAALPLSLSIIGGAIADRMLGFYYTAIMGCILLIVGNLILTLQNINYFYLGLATVMMGVGLLKPNNSNLLGEFYKENIVKREKAYSLFYICINFGAILGPICYGVFSQQMSYKACFYVSAVLISSAMTVLLTIKKNSHLEEITFDEIFQTIMLISFFIGIAYLILMFCHYFGFVIASVFFVSAFFLFNHVKNGNAEVRFSIFYLMVPIGSCIIYFACLQQIYSTLLIYIDSSMRREIFGFSIPTTSFSAIEPCCLFLMVPILNWIWNKWKVEHEKKIFAGLISSVFSFLFFALSSFFVSKIENFSLFFIIIGNVFLAIGELCTIPVTISLINLIAPQKYKGTYMGIFYFSLTLSGYLAGTIAQFAPVNKAGSEFAWFFLFVAGMLLVAVFGVSLMTIFLKDRYRI